MTDRVRGLHVILEEPMRKDDASQLAEAISALRGVAMVDLDGPVGPVNAEVRAREREIERALTLLAYGIATGRKVAAEVSE